MEIRTSLLDRLMAGESANEILEFRRRNSKGLSSLITNVCRDLEALLNSKRSWLTWPAEYDELDRSLLNYGLPDFSGATFASPSDQSQLCRRIETLIGYFEPRLTSVRVSLPRIAEGPVRVLQFTIRARLVWEGQGESVLFASRLDPKLGEYRVVKEPG